MKSMSMVWWIFTGKGISFPTTVWPGCSPQTGISLHCLSTGEGGCSRVKGCVLKSLSRVWLLATPCTVAHQAPLSMGILQAFSTGVGCHFLLQRIFPTQGSNPGILHCRQILYHLSHQGSRLSVELNAPSPHSPPLTDILRWFTLSLYSSLPNTN